MEQIYVTMLGKFDICVNGTSALSNLTNSTKSILLLKYFLLNRGRSLTTTNLINIFWTEPDKSANPESALKTMISRIRTSLAAASPALKNCILFENKSYAWNSEIQCTVDVFEFEELCRLLQGFNYFDNEVRVRYIRMLDIYGGDLTYSSSEEDWLVSHSMYLHHLYLELTLRFIELLKTEKDYETVIHVCRIALDIDAFDETLNLELMSALKELGHNSEALMQYHHITGAYYKYLGIDPSEKILSFYRNLIKSNLSAETDVGMIRRTLKDTETDSGAFVCDYSIFNDIYQLQLRNLERQNNRMFLALITVNSTLDEAPDPMVLDGVMRKLLEILQKCLRKGDTIARYSTSQYTVLLPMLNLTNGRVLVTRVKKMFYKKCTDSNFNVNFQFCGME